MWLYDESFESAVAGRLGCGLALTKSLTSRYLSNSVRANSRISSRVEEGGISALLSVPLAGRDAVTMSEHTMYRSHDLSPQRDHFLSLHKLLLVSVSSKR